MSAHGVLRKSRKRWKVAGVSILLPSFSPDRPPLFLRKRLLASLRAPFYAGLSNPFDIVVRVSCELLEALNPIVPVGRLRIRPSSPIMMDRCLWVVVNQTCAEYPAARPAQLPP